MSDTQNTHFKNIRLKLSNLQLQMMFQEFFMTERKLKSG